MEGTGTHPSGLAQKRRETHINMSCTSEVAPVLAEDLTRQREHPRGQRLTW